MNTSLNPNTATPLYQQLMEKISAKIASGEYQPGDKLPPEIELAKQNQVSVITARKALDELARQGHVERRQGKGTFVAKPKYGRDYTQIQSFSDSCKARGLLPGASLLRQALITPGEQICTQLGISKGSQAVEIVRLRYVNAEPMVIETNYFSVEYAFLLREDMTSSLFQLLKDYCGITVEKSKKVIEICRATLEEAQALNLHTGDALLLVSSVAYTSDNQPIYVCRQVINGERFQLIL